MDETELVVLVSEDGTPIGTSPKERVHTAATPLHLAFSCYLMDPQGRVLVTRRALSKRAWPGVWTNSFCGHPAPDEELGAALHRRARQELDTVIDTIVERLPDYRYRAVDADGVVENEICPVFTATVGDEVRPEPSEVLEWTWVDPESLLASVTSTPFVFSPWLREQLPQLFEVGAFRGGQMRE